MDEPGKFSEKVQGWEVGLRINGTDILTIGSQHLAGIENIDDYADTVRTAAQHLLSFIGPSQDLSSND